MSEDNTFNFYFPFFFFFQVELNPYAAHVYFNRANLYASLRKYKESEEDYTRGEKLDLFSCAFDIDGLYVTSWRPCWCSPLGETTKQIFFCFVHQHGDNANHLFNSYWLGTR